MGRKANFEEKQKKGPGKKAKKQQAPVYSFDVREFDGNRKLTSRDKARAKKRALKAAAQQERKAKRQKTAQQKSNEDELDSTGEEQFSPEEMAELQESAAAQGPPQEKTKKTLFGEEDSDEDKEEEEEDDDDSEGEDSADDIETDLEKMSKKLEKENQRRLAEGEAYMEEATSKVGVQIPSLEEVKKEMTGETEPDLPTINSRIKDTAFILADFKKRHEEGRNRAEYMEIFLMDLSTYYSYNTFLMEKLLHMFGPTELIEFLEANELPRPVTIRTNTLRSRRKVLATSLIDRGVDVDIIPWSRVGLVVMRTPGNVTLGATPEYLAGHYILQGASSFLPVMALSPKEGEKILDMCAAPGGKATHIAAIMRNTGMLVANDVNKDRVKAVVGNFHRLGITNSVITTNDGRCFPKIMPRGFDRVLLDAPCSGTGVISKDERVKISKDPKDINRCSHLQRELLLAAIDSVHKFDGINGYVVYSTCSVLVEENEEVVEYALKKRNVQLVSTGLDIGKPGFVNYRGKRFNSTMNLCKRIYPHSYNMDGFFIAKLKKMDDIEAPSQTQAVVKGK
ncbi:hypothetical protein Pmani_029551 [Petrolisthes manimaculis]|uniref:SAM-dependent MTase RsmB/NOP-type domain-containing protein n=1 Tax=Petrolisthes manimaculis TaxID=1843537 RepID=A0AAE1NZC0_9EUCA|nr:hypothetical protein Pmani_029551 [Petrolisthes manimaculis]